jgi:ABC-2 type transport system permease protein
MGKIGIIIQREYLNRVKNKTFIVMCFVAPLLFAALFIVPALLAGQPGQVREIVVVDESGCPDSVGYAFVFQDTQNLRFNYNHVYEKLGDVKKAYKDSEQVSLLYIPENFMGGCENDSGVVHSMGLTIKLISQNEPGANTLSLLERIVSTEVQRDMMRVSHISQRAIDLSLKKVSVANEVNGKVQVSEVKGIVGLAVGMVIYLYILLFGVLVMRSVTEEKTSRVVEVIISSVRPFQLMLGKILATALAGLTQFAAWVIISLLIITPIVSQINDQKLDFSSQIPNQMQTGIVVDDAPSLGKIEITKTTIESVETLLSIPWGNLIPAFAFYFIFGYLMYASMFAAVGSAVDTEADTGQFSLPLTIPLIISISSFGTILNAPDGPIAKWLSMIPFTSPVVMLMRIPFGGVQIWEICVSIGILIVSFLLMTWLAGKIYRVGILMYGKKASWKELIKWLFYKA